jgi:DNA-binding beta-propeller fold protein YncE
MLTSAAALTLLAAPLLQLRQTIPLAGVEGRIDHLSVDVKGQRLFVAALGNNTLEVIDLRSGKRVQSLPGLNEPQGVIYIPELNKIFMASGKDGKCRIFDAASLKLIQTEDFSDDADNLRYDAAAKQIYVGYGDGALGIMDAVTGKRAGNIPLDAHPESFQLEKSGPRIFVNVPKAGHIAVVDRQKRAVIAKWPLRGVAANYPMALDESNRRLFIGCRKPAKLVVFDTATGKEVASLATVGDTDDLFFDVSRKQIYVSGGEGFLSVISQRDADRYEAVSKIPTASGARTSLFSADLNRLYLAVPHRGSQLAEIRVYAGNP